MTDRQLIFIISQPRSGSTMLQHCLSGHPSIDSTSEHWMLLNFFAVERPELQASIYDSDLAASAFREYLNQFAIGELYKGALGDFCLRMYEPILKDPSNRVLDKTPRYYEIFESMLEVFPGAKFIVLKRNPLAVLNSIIKTWGYKDLETLARRHARDVLHAPVILNRVCKEYGLRDNVTVVSYEDILRNYSDEVGSLFEFLGVDNASSEASDFKYDPQVVGKYGDPKGVREYAGISRDNVDQWLEDFEASDHRDLLRGYEFHLGADFLTDYGYDLHGPKETAAFSAFRNFSISFDERHGLRKQVQARLRAKVESLFI